MSGAAQALGAIRREATARVRPAPGLIVAATLAISRVLAADVVAAPPTDLSVTVYRSPVRDSGSIDLDDLGGFALVSETRIVRLPPGLSRLRFEGVADGIEPVSAIVTGLPEGVVEKNREGKLLSPAALVEAALGKPVSLLRFDKKSGRQRQVTGTIRSDNDGVVFESPEGVEALRCSGLPETFSFEGRGDLAATPTLSVLVRSKQESTRTVTLSYLASDFDWSADYIATLSPDEKTLDLGAWVTLANGNGTGFPSARTQVVAGRLNRESGEVEPLDAGGPILANCWPRGSTSDPVEVLMFKRSLSGDALASMTSLRARAQSAPTEEIIVTAQRAVVEEQLGDLKLYRVPDRTTVSSRQSKQVRLLDRQGIPVRVIYGADVGPGGSEFGDSDFVPATVLLRTTNNAANHLGLPLPSGRVSVFAVASPAGTHGDTGPASILRHESGLRDLAVDEEVEIDLGESADVRVAAVTEKIDIDPAKARTLPLVPGVSIRTTRLDAVRRVDITNARARESPFELRLSLPAGAIVVRADHPVGRRNGRPIIKLEVPAQSSVTVRFQTQTAEARVQRSAR